MARMDETPDKETTDLLQTFYLALKQDVDKLRPGTRMGVGEMNGCPLVQFSTAQGELRSFRIFMEITEDGITPTFEEVYY